MKAQERYDLAAVALKRQWSDRYGFFTDYREMVDMLTAEDIKGLNDIARAFLHFERLAKVHFKFERPEVLTKKRIKEIKAELPTYQETIE